ncbi:ribosomal protein s kinase alpha [Echinococcus multilocularis]|uniref:Ribosomal protein s kinase alpha n=1 Tax=Echinococcus multilocularis TaxID=6211 RepID=A0A068YNY8_ECHMU|nr:ribosomal protein s kinase alpha [Echinococcus multilocularis]
MKRFFLQNSIALLCALHLHRILVHLALCHHKPLSLHTLSHFLKLCTSYPRATQGSHLDLVAPTCHLNHMPEGDAEFYSPHIICGPQCLRAMRTVHWDLKPLDIFLLHSDHLLTTRVDQPPDTLEKQRPPN